MDLNEAIKHCNDVFKTCDNPECRQEHRQLAVWLKLLKKLGNEWYDVTTKLKSGKQAAEYNRDRISETSSEYPNKFFYDGVAHAYEEALKIFDEVVRKEEYE